MDPVQQHTLGNSSEKFKNIASDNSSINHISGLLSRMDTKPKQKLSLSGS